MMIWGAYLNELVNLIEKRCYLDSDPEPRGFPVFHPRKWWPIWIENGWFFFKIDVYSDRTVILSFNILNYPTKLSRSCLEACPTNGSKFFWRSRIGVGLLNLLSGWFIKSHWLTINKVPRNRMNFIVFISFWWKKYRIIII